RCLSLLFFFFQAEDGIRDRNVTGVQTCALPISRLRGEPLLADEERERQCGRQPGHEGEPERRPVRAGRFGEPVGGHLVQDDPRRSEERRVGKEWRSGRAAYKYKNENDRQVKQL